VGHLLMFVSPSSWANKNRTLCSELLQDQHSPSTHPWHFRQYQGVCKAATLQAHSSSVNGSSAVLVAGQNSFKGI